MSRCQNISMSRSQNISMSRTTSLVYVCSVVPTVLAPNALAAMLTYHDDLD